MNRGTIFGRYIILTCIIFVVLIPAVWLLHRIEAATLTPSAPEEMYEIRQVVDINQGSNSSYPSYLTPLSGKLFFDAGKAFD